MGTPLNPTLSKQRYAGGWLLRHELDHAYHFETVILDNSAGTAVLHAPAGTPMTGAVPTVAASISGCNGILLETARVQPGENVQVAIFKRGPAVVDADALPLTDVVAGAAYTLADYKTAILAFTPINTVVFRPQPTLVTEQTT